jgi:hypothetical protein
MQAVPLAWTGIHSPYAAFDSSKSPCKVGRLQACRVRIGASFGIGIFAVQGVGYHSGDGGAGGKMKFIYFLRGRRRLPARTVLSELMFYAPADALK